MKKTKSNQGMKGVGNDIIEIERIKSAIEKHGDHFYHKLYTQKELEYCLKHQNPAAALAGRFSAKEAIVKALGTGFGKDVSWLDITILNDEKGRPYPIFSETFNERFDFPEIHISISHCKHYATAVAIWT